MGGLKREREKKPSEGKKLFRWEKLGGRILWRFTLAEIGKSRESEVLGSIVDKKEVNLLLKNRQATLMKPHELTEEKGRD